MKIIITESQYAKINHKLLLEIRPHKCLPSDYRPGTEYGRDELAKIFVCLTGEPQKFPVRAVREFFFPKDPQGRTLKMDPMNMRTNQSPHPFSMDRMVNFEKKITRNITMGVTKISMDRFAPIVVNGFSIMQQRPDYNKRVGYQINKIIENNYDTLSVTPDDEPIAFESIGGKLYLQEGWHRVMAILYLLQKGEIKPDDAKVYSVILYRESSYKPQYQMMNS
jgi:hypothetical protein